MIEESLFRMACRRRIGQGAKIEKGLTRSLYQRVDCRRWSPSMKLSREERNVFERDTGYLEEKEQIEIHRLIIISTCFIQRRSRKMEKEIYFLLRLLLLVTWTEVVVVMVIDF